MPAEFRLEAERSVEPLRSTPSLAKLCAHQPTLSIPLEVADAGGGIAAGGGTATTAGGAEPAAGPPNIDASSWPSLPRTGGDAWVASDGGSGGGGGGGGHQRRVRHAGRRAGRPVGRAAEGAEEVERVADAGRLRGGGRRRGGGGRHARDERLGPDARRRRRAAGARREGEEVARRRAPPATATGVGAFGASKGVAAT